MTRPDHTSTPRTSGGGTVVEASLLSVGFEVRTSETALLEAQKPLLRPYTTLLAQNAWTVIPAEDYEYLSLPYPRAWRARMAARRAVARLNIHRADQIVCLTESMGELVEAMTKTPVTVAPILAPADLPTLSRTVAPPHEGEAQVTIVVPGTITWYKRPQLSLQIAHDLGRALGVSPQVLFAGRDDGTGAWAAVEKEARRLRLNVTRKTLSRQRMAKALRSSTATIIPSELESLSLSLSEALILSPRVVASSLPVHRELSVRLGRTPVWLETWLPDEIAAIPTSTVGAESIKASWQEVGKALGLPLRTDEGEAA